jgi:hypothetical protein
MGLTQGRDVEAGVVIVLAAVIFTIALCPLLRPGAQDGEGMKNGKV